jgi:hypothetical protein
LVWRDQQLGPGAVCKPANRPAIALTPSKLLKMSKGNLRRHLEAAVKSALGKLRVPDDLRHHRVRGHGL